MARGYVRERIVSNTTGLPLSNATVTVREVGTTDALAATMYDALSGGVPVPNPITTGADGVVAFYLDVPQDVDFRVAADGYPDATISSIKVHYDQSDLVDKTSPQTLSGPKTLTNAILNNPEINNATYPSGLVFSDPELRNARIKSVSGGADIARFDDGLTYMPGPLKIGTDTGATSDTAHLMYIHKTVTGAALNNIVDTFLVEVNGQTDDASDIGAVAGFARALTATGKVSMRGLAGQMTIDAGAQKANRESVELGVHNALAITSKADNRTAFDVEAPFGAVGILLSAYSGTQADGNPAARANTAIVVNTFSGSGGHWKQFEVFYDVNDTKAWQVNDQGNVVAGGGGNNAAEVVYGFLDTNGDKDAGTGFYWGGNDVIAAAINSSEIARFTSVGLGVGGTPPAGSRLYVTGGRTEIAELKQSGNWGLNGVTPSATQSGWAPTGGTTSRGGNVSTMTTAQLGDMVYTLINDLKTKGALAA